MNYIRAIRKLVDQLRFSDLQSSAQLYLDETGDLLVLPLIALANAHLGHMQTAIAAVDRAESFLMELDLDARIDLAGACCLLAQVERAEVLLENAVNEKADHALALARLAWVRLQQGKIEQAKELYQRSAELESFRLPVWIALSRIHLERNDIVGAQNALEAATGQLAAILTDMPGMTVNMFTDHLRGLQLEIWVAADNLAEAEQWLEQCRQTVDESTWVNLVTGYAIMLAGIDKHAASEAALRDALKHYPDNLELISQLAELAQIQGRTLQAIRLLYRAIALARKTDKLEVGLWVRLSNACLHQNDKQARSAAEKAMQLAEVLQVSDEYPEARITQIRLQAKNALAQVESQEQHFDVADSLFREVLEVNPYFQPALQGLGQQQMQRGKLDEAIELFERIKQIDPAKGYSSLINARQFPEDEETLLRMEKMARQPTLEGQVRSGLLFQLTSAWEKRKEYDKAMALANDANSGSRQHLHYDSQAHRQHCARIRQAFSKALFEHRKDCGYRGENESLPVFVLGMPRSGTTLVEQIIASHSQVFGAGELGVIPSRIAGLNRWERHTGSGRTYPDCIDDLTPYVVDGIAKGVLDELRDLAAEDKPKAKFIVDKLPHNFENIGFIKFLFPKAKIISVRRDPRDIAISNYFTDYQAKHGGMGFAYDLEWIGEQLADHNLLMHTWNELFPGEILEVNYEDVVENTEAEARRMLDYLGVAWEETVLSFNKLERPVKTASVWQVRQPIYKTSKARWEHYQNHLSNLIKGTNTKIEWDAIEDMVTLPIPGMLTDGVALYKEDKLDEAEYEFKKLLHHLPEHAAANHMVGIIYARKGHLEEAVALMEKALEKCSWNQAWRKDLILACEITGKADRAAELQSSMKNSSPAEEDPAMALDDEQAEALLTS